MHFLFLHLALIKLFSYVPPVDKEVHGGVLKLADGRLGTEGPVKLSYPPSISDIEWFCMDVRSLSNPWV